MTPEKLTEDETLKAVRVLIGDIDVYGIMEKDNETFDNLKIACYVVDKLLSDIDDVTRHRHRAPYTMKRSAQYASDFFKQIGIPE